MKKVILILSVWILVAPSAVYAHGPSRVKVEETILLNAAPNVVWKQIKDFDNLHSWLPLVEKTTSEGGNEKGATRELSLKDGGTIKEELKKYSDSKMSYSYKITEMSTAKTIDYAGETLEIKVLPVSNYKAWISVESDGTSGSKVTWKAKFYRGYMNNNPPEQLNEDAAMSAVTKVFKAGLTNLKKIVDG